MSCGSGRKNPKLMISTFKRFCPPPPPSLFPRSRVKNFCPPPPLNRRVNFSCLSSHLPAPLDCKHYSSNIYFKHTSHILPVAGLGVRDAALFVVSVVVHGVTLAIKNQIKNEINRQHLVNQFVKVVHVQTYPRCLSENLLVFNCGSTGNLNVAGFDK